MQLSSKVRMNRLFNNGKCLDVAIDHGIANEPDFLIGLEDIERVMGNLIAARPDAIQVNYGQSGAAAARAAARKAGAGDAHRRRQRL